MSQSEDLDTKAASEYGGLIQNLLIQFLAVTFILVLAQVSWAGEPDDFSARMDSSPAVGNSGIESTVNLILDMAVADYVANPDGQCDSGKMMGILDENLDRNLPKIYQGIYYNVPFAGSKKLGDVPYGSGKPYTGTYFSQSMKVKLKDQTVVMGIDKIDHFFSHGALYWEMVGRDPKLPESKVKKALEIGQQQESATWGLQNTKVKSYGDLSANYHGLYFWRDLFYGQPPFLTCRDGKYIRTRDFKVEDYFHGSMDETLNCSSYADEETYSRIHKVNSQRNIKCPAVEDSCEKFKKDLGKYAEQILHPTCFNKNASFVEAASPRSTKDVIDMAQAVMGGGGNFLIFKLFGKSKKLGPMNSEAGVK